jgi:hypothetical protein
MRKLIILTLSLVALAAVVATPWAYDAYEGGEYNFPPRMLEAVKATDG